MPVTPDTSDELPSTFSQYPAYYMYFRNHDSYQYDLHIVLQNQEESQGPEEIQGEIQEEIQGPEEISELDEDYSEEGPNHEQLVSMIYHNRNNQMMLDVLRFEHDALEQRISDQRISLEQARLSHQIQLYRFFRQQNGEEYKTSFVLATHNEIYPHDTEEDTKCPICCSSFVKGDESPILECCHTFHSSCITEWINTDSGSGKNHTCPICREKLSVRIQRTHPRPGVASGSEE